jgi:HEAT repeat protein
VRAYLIAELDEASDALLVGAAAQAVGWLKDERAIPALERILARPEGDLAITEALNGLGAMGGDAAKNAILRYIDKEHTSAYDVWAGRVLTFSNRAAAAEAARRVLEGPYAEKLAANDRDYIASFAK